METGKFTCYAINISQTGGGIISLQIYSALYNAGPKATHNHMKSCLRLLMVPILPGRKMRQLIQATRLERPLSFTLPIYDLEIRTLNNYTSSIVSSPFRGRWWFDPPNKAKAGPYKGVIHLVILGH